MDKRKTIFISHRTSDKEIADMLQDYFVAMGVPRDLVFCSSLPGNDVSEKISVEVKRALQNSQLNLVILSKEYYESAYCLNEAGIIWFHDEIPAIPIALPEINHNNMYGFLNGDYKIRRLDNLDDISFIYDKVCEIFQVNQVKLSIANVENNKLINRYQQYIGNSRITVDSDKEDRDFLQDITTDDERIVLYYILQKMKRKIRQDEIKQWLAENEIYGINVDNAFDLLSELGAGKNENDILELDINHFRRFSTNAEDLKHQIESSISRYQNLSSELFKKAWISGELTDELKLFIVYIIDERMTKFGDRWMQEQQVEHIKVWESRNNLSDILSSYYGSCLSWFKEKQLVYESDWTSYGNPREYSLCPSLKNYLFSTEFPYMKELLNVMKTYEMELPFF